jgi:hypothetical protein
MKNQGVGLQRPAPFSFPECRRSGNCRIGPRNGPHRRIFKALRKGSTPLAGSARSFVSFEEEREEGM